MNFFSHLFTPTASMPVLHREATPGIPSTTNPNAPENKADVRGGDWNANVVIPTGRRSLLIPAWCRGVSLIMQTMGQLKVQWQTKNPAGGNFIEDDYSPLGTKINYMLQVRPNPLMTASEMQQQIEFNKIYWGNAYVYIERNEYEDPIALWLCHGATGGYNPLMDTYNLTYNGLGGPKVLVNEPSRNILHFKNVFLTDDGYHGIPMIWVAMNTLSIAATGNDQALQDLAKGGKMKLVLGEQPKGSQGLLSGGLYSKEQSDAYAKEFEQQMYSHDVVSLRGLDKIQVISQTSQQLQLLEQRQMEVSEIARILGVPRIMMMEEQGSNYKMPEHATQEFMLRTIQPRICTMEDELNSKLLRPEDFNKRRIHLCELALRRLDAKGQAEIDKLHLESGWSPNEVRAQYDLPSVKGGDDHFVNAQLGPLGSNKINGNTTVKQETR